MSTGVDGRRADLVVVGGGPAGYGAALRAARLGAQVVLVTDEAPGGTCLHRGCIPSKALLEVARRARELREAGAFGLRVEGVAVDLSSVRAFRDRAVRTLAAGLDHLLRAAGVEVVRGRGRLEGPGRVRVDRVADPSPGDTGAQRGGASARRGVTVAAPGPAAPRGEEAAGESLLLAAPRIVVATGSVPVRLPWARGQAFWDSARALALASVPPRLVVVGAGPVGMELATVYHALGSRVTVVELLPRVLPGEDEDVSAEMARLYERRGIRLLTGVRVAAAEAGTGVVRLHLEPSGPAGAPASAAGAAGASVAGGARAVAGGNPPPSLLEAEAVLVAAGRRPHTGGLGLETVGLAPETGTGRGPGSTRREGAPAQHGGWLAVGSDLATAAPGIWAAGDVVGRRLLAHYALAQGVAAVEAAFGQPRTVDLEVVPACTFTLPEVGSVGLTEAQAAARGPVLVGRFPFRANGRAVAAGERDGFVKVVADGESRRVLGVHVVGPGAAEMVHEGALAVAAGLGLDRLAATIHAHPTHSEALAEATLLAAGLPRHFVS